MLLTLNFNLSDADEFEATIEQLTDLAAESITPETPVLPDEAVSRAGIYEDHP